MKILLSILTLLVFKITNNAEVKSNFFLNSISKSEVLDTSSNIDRVTIISFKKEYNTSSNFWQEYSLKCNNWALNKMKISQIIRSRKKIDKFEFSYFYEVLPCTYSGYVLLNNEKYAFEINAGSFLILNRNKNYYYYRCSNKSTVKYFITPPATSDSM